MTYTFKLSRRLAALHVVGVGAVLAIACSGGDANSPSGPDETPPSADGVAILPTSATIETNQPIKFVATALDSLDTSAAESIEWIATGGTITSQGVFTSTSTGTFRVVGKKRGHNKPPKDTSVVIVVPPQPTLVEIIVTPSPASVVAGQSIAFKATGKLADGTITPIGVVWSGTGGTIDGGGNYKAGTTPGTYRVIATSTSGTIADTVAVTVTAAPAPTLAKVVISPKTATVAAGGTVRFVAYGRSATGDSMAVSVTYAATGGTITTSGAYTAGSTAGTYRVTATASTGQADTAVVTVTTTGTPSPNRVGWYVAPNGSSSGNGSMSSPWDLASVLSGRKTIAPGDTVWVRGGTYRGRFVNYLNGTSSKQIVIRRYPGERATIDGDITVMGSYVTFWGLEVMSSNPLAVEALGLNIKSPGSKFINLVVHDANMSGMGVWVEAPNAEVYGCLVYNNGTHPNLDHGIYTQNQTGTKLIRDNVIFNNWTYGLHVYTSTPGYLNNFTIDGNIAFNNGSTGAWGTAPDMLVTGSSVLATGIRVTNNMTYRRNDGDRTARLGPGQDLTLTGNYFVGPVDLTSWSSLTQSGNTMLSSASPPTSGTKVVVRPNLYEAGRANIAIYNWSGLATVPVDVSNVLKAGDTYELRNVQNFYGAPTLSGTYNGGSLQVPMTAVTPPPTIGRTANTAKPTGPTFNAFVLLKTN